MVLEQGGVERLERLEVVLASLVAHGALTVYVVVVERERTRAKAVHAELRGEALDERGLARRRGPRDVGDDVDAIGAARDRVGDATYPLLVEAFGHADDLVDRGRDTSSL